jgi:DNA-binding transcriptional LysR family regulator
MPIKLSFEVLEVLDAIERTGTFAEAAEALHRVPSSITYLVQKVESDMDVELFDRSGRRATLTQAGRAIVDEGRRLLRAARHLEVKAKGIRDGWESELRLCFDEILPFESLWPHVNGFCDLEMPTQLRLSTEVLGGVWDALISRRVDLAVGTVGEPPLDTNIVARPIGTLHHVFVLAPEHPLAQVPEPLESETIARHRGVVMSDTSLELDPQAVAIHEGQPLIFVPTREAKLQALCEGIAVGMLPGPLAASLIGAGTLVARRIVGVREYSNCYLARRRDKEGKALDWWIAQLDHPDMIERLFKKQR